MNTSVKSERRFLYIEYLRVLSALAVIMVHVSGANWFRIEIGSPNWIAQSFYNVGARFGVCIFCMITGALLLQPEKKIGISDLFPKYIKRILICYVAWVFLYAVLYTVMNQGDLQYFLLRLVKLPDHLWYLLMIMGMYVALPVLRLITKNRALTRYMIIALVIWGTVGLITTTSGFFKDIAGENLGYQMWTSFLGNLEEVKFSFTPGYLAFFLLGHQIHEYGLGKWRKWIVWASIPCLLLSGLLTVVISAVTGKYVYAFMLENNPFVLLACMGIFGFFREHESIRFIERKNTKIARFMLWLGSHTFGIYLIHFAIRDILAHYFNFTVASYPAIVSVPVNTILLFVISLLLTAVIKKVPVLKTIVS